MEGSTQMSRVEVIKKVYINEETAERIPYERLAITGSIDGVENTLEIKLAKAELQLAKILLNSSEELQITQGDKREGQKIKVNRKNSSVLEDIEESDLLG